MLLPPAAIALASADAPPMPAPTLTPRELVDRLDARHEELIARLDELNAQIEAALAEFGRPRVANATEERAKKAA